MKYQFQSTNINLTGVDRDLLNKKTSRLEKYLEPPFQTSIRIIRDAHHLKGDIITCRVNIEQGKKVFHAERTADTVQNAIDEALQALTSELSKHHTKTKKKRL